MVRLEDRPVGVEAGCWGGRKLYPRPRLSQAGGHGKSLWRRAFLSEEAVDPCLQRAGTCRLRVEYFQLVQQQVWAWEPSRTGAGWPITPQVRPAGPREGCCAGTPGGLARRPPPRPATRPSRERERWVPKQSPAARPKPASVDRTGFSEGLLWCLKRHQGLWRGSHLFPERKRGRSCLLACLYVCLLEGSHPGWSPGPRLRLAPGQTRPGPPIPSRPGARSPGPLGPTGKASQASDGAREGVLGGSAFERSVGPRESSSEQILGVRPPH